MRFLRKLEIDLPEDPRIPLLRIYPKDAPPCYRDTCSTMFIAALFLITRTWKLPRYPTTEEWIQKMWFIYTVEYYSAIKNKEILSFAGKWMELEIIILSGVWILANTTTTTKEQDTKIQSPELKKSIS